MKRGFSHIPLSKPTATSMMFLKPVSTLHRGYFGHEYRLDTDKPVYIHGRKTTVVPDFSYRRLQQQILQRS